MMRLTAAIISVAACLMLMIVTVAPPAHAAKVWKTARIVNPSLCRVHGHIWHVTCQQNRVIRAQWTCFVFDDHIHKCSRAEARMVMRGKYRVRIYRG